MIVNYSDKEVIPDGESIFLAGPTPRSEEVETWRNEAIEILKELGFDGVIAVPELEHDNRTFDYNNQTWWERDSLYPANAVVFWVPRNMKTMPALTTNVEFGYWLAKNADKVVYGRPDDSEKNKYLDWLYRVETGKEACNNLRDTLKAAIEVAKNNKTKDTDYYELKTLQRTIKVYPELMTLVGETQFTPESYGVDSDKKTYGSILFPDLDKNNLKEFDRTVLSVLLYYYIKENRYDKFVKQQSGENKLTRETFNKIRKFMLTNFDTKEKESLLLYYMVINDLGKSTQVIEMLKAKGIESVDHDLLLNYLLQFNMLPTLDNFSKESKNSLKNVLDNGINVGQYIQGECVDYSFDKVLNLSQFERNLMIAEAMLDIGGVLGHVNNLEGSVILNESTANNILTAADVLSTCEDKTRVFDEFLSRKAKDMQIWFLNPELNKAITRICLMMRLNRKQDIEVVENEIMSNLEDYRMLIHEFNQSGYNNTPAILLYYSPALLSNSWGYFRKNGSTNPILDSLKVCLPFMEKIMKETRLSINDNTNGVITVMLRDAAMVAAQNPCELNNLEVNILNSEEVAIQYKK